MFLINSTMAPDDFPLYHRLETVIIKQNATSNVVKWVFFPQVPSRKINIFPYLGVIALYFWTFFWIFNKFEIELNKTISYIFV